MTALRLDHGRLSRVLTEIDAAESRLAVAPEESRALVIEALRYLIEYQYSTHHPREDQLFERIARRAPELRLQMVRLMGEHADGLAQTGRLAEHLAGADVKSLGGRAGARLSRELHQYVRHARSHMRHEERVFYAGSEKLLKPSDWRDLSDAPVPDDPLSDPALLAGRYPGIAERLADPGRLAPGATPEGSATAGAVVLQGFERLLDVYGDLLHDAMELVTSTLSSARAVRTPAGLVRVTWRHSRDSLVLAGRCVSDHVEVVLGTTAALAGLKNVPERR